jgi:hypothetical protein
MTRRCGRASLTVELANRLAIGPAAELQAGRQSNQRLLAILQVSGYTGFESAAQRLSPTTPMHSDRRKVIGGRLRLSAAGDDER